MSINYFAVCDQHRRRVLLCTAGGAWGAFGIASNDDEGRRRALDFIAGPRHSGCKLRIESEHALSPYAEEDD